jgi:hypothetical protein
MSKAKPEKEKRINLTAERQAEYEAWHEAVREAGRAMLPRLRALSLPDLHALVLAADAPLNQWPVYQTGERRYAMPLWDKRGMTGAELVALVVFGLWLYMGESEHMVGGSIVGDWGEVIKAVI